MLRLSELKLPLDHGEEDLAAAVCRRLRIPPEALRSHQLVRRSVDARRRDAISLVYCLDLDLDLSDAARRTLLHRFRADPHLRPAPDTRYRPVIDPWDPVSADGIGDRSFRPLVIGAGPCGYFAALLLAQMGLRPLLLERGKPVRERTADTFDGAINGAFSALIGFWVGSSSSAMRKEATISTWASQANPPGPKT
jgi:uncharacterized FAD-dependent dehydrogenase